MIKQFTKEEIINICDTAGICFAPIARPEDLFDDPQLNQGDYGLLETEFPNGEKTKMPRIPLQFGSYDLNKRKDPPATIGADTREVLTALGYDEKNINELAQRKIVAVG
jgi:crotonobetainyl-CoA:carnitine CoA-transferase CaiB-like acyl-CoA transferase